MPYCFGHTVSIVIPGGEAMSFDPGQDSTLRERAERFVRSWGVRIGGVGSFLNSLVFNFVETILLKRVLYNIL